MKTSILTILANLSFFLTIVFLIGYLSGGDIPYEINGSEFKFTFMPLKALACAVLFFVLAIIFFALIY